MYKILYLPTGECVENVEFSTVPDADIAIQSRKFYIYTSYEGTESNPTNKLWYDMENTYGFWQKRILIPKYHLEVVSVEDAL